MILGEPGAGEIGAHLDAAPSRLMSSATRVELGIVIEARLGMAGADVVARFLRDAQVEVVPLGAEAAERALGGWRRYGKGHHRAGLNLGDCFGYALAEQTGFAMLCTGEDFAATDLEVLRPAG